MALGCPVLEDEWGWGGVWGREVGRGGDRVREVGRGRGWVRLGIGVVEVDSGRNNVIKAFERGLRMEIWVEPWQTRMFC